MLIISGVTNIILAILLIAITIFYIKLVNLYNKDTDKNFSNKLELDRLKIELAYKEDMEKSLRFQLDHIKKIQKKKKNVKIEKMLKSLEFSINNNHNVAEATEAYLKLLKETQI